MTDAQLEKHLRMWRAELARRNTGARHERWLRRVIARAKAQLEANRITGTAPPRMQAVHHALKFVGTVEHPPGSNGGPHIDEWQHRFGISHQPWCGAFAGSMIESTGHTVDKGVVYTPNIKAFAQSATGGFLKWIPVEEAAWARGGDLVLYDFYGKGICHVGMLRERPANGQILTVEGNTSSGGGSQDNGGGVFARTRPLDHTVAGFARWWTGK